MLLVLWLAGCGSGTLAGTASGSGNQPTPSIVSQPADQSIPMGLPGIFSVQAIGPNLQYQWSRNGSSISGATGSSYTTPPTAFTDSGSVFSVIVSNPAGSVTSKPATLAVTARAPRPGDLRFQQVDAASTVNGYGIATGVVPEGCPAPGAGGILEEYPSTTGTGFFLGNDQCLSQFEAFSLPSGVSGLNTGYAAIPTQSYQGVLTATPFITLPGPSDSGSVIISLSLLPAFNSAALGFIHSSTSSGFDRTEYTVAASGLQALATQEGLRGRVLTAISYDGTQADVFSYAWTGDPNAVYEAKVVFSTLDTATGDITALAAEGYILTATGGTQAADGSGVVLIGTRVQGDSMPRPILVGDVLAGTVDAVFAKGYATVAVVTKYRNSGLVLKNYIGER